MRHGGNEVKVYLCLFTCVATRAVHFEIVQDQTAESRFESLLGDDHSPE